MTDTNTSAETSGAPSGSLSSLIVNPSTTSIALRDGEVVEGMKQDSSYKLNTYDATQGDGVSLLSSAKTQAGSPTANLTKDTLVNYQGMDITLQNAERMGLVKQVDGKYVEVAPGEQPKATDDAPEEDLGESLGNDIEAELSALSEAIPPSLQVSVIEAVMRQGLDATNLNDLAFETGIKQEELRGRFGAIEKAFRGQADQALMAAGMGQEDIPAFVKWAQEKHKGAFDDACRNHVYNRSTKGYAALAKTWMNTTAPSAASLPASVNPRTVRGETLVTIPGYPEMSLKVATRLGLI